MNKTLFSAATAIVAVLVLTACSEAPTTPAPTTEAAKPAAPSGPVPALTAFYEMYKPARTWATDLLPLSLTSGEIKGIANQDGKAALWTAVFVSPSRREARIFTYAVADQGGAINKGVTAGAAQSWSGATAKSRPFQTTDFGIDSDAAFKTAEAKAAVWLKSHPGKKVSMTLVSDVRFPAPIWVVMWGTPSSGYMAFIDAVTGTAVRGH